MANGIPILLNASIAINIPIPLLIADNPQIPNERNITLWGIYDSATQQPALLAESVISFGFKKEYKISDYPIEVGTFANYNKVDLPYIGMIRMSMGGSTLDRAEFLDKLVELGTSTQLFDIVTPEHVYLNANIVDYDYARTATNGAGLIVADIKLMEVRTTAQASFNKTQSTTDTASVNGGQVAPSAPIPQNQQPAEVVQAAQQPDIFPLGYHVPNIGAPL